MARSKETSPAARWLAVGLIAGLALALARVLLLFGMEQVSHGGDTELFRVRLAAGLPRILLEAGLAGCFAGALAAFTRSRTGSARVAAWFATAGLGGLAFGAVALGWFGDASRRVGLGTTTGQATSLIALVCLCGCAALLPLVVARLRRARAWIVACGAVALLSPVALRFLAQPDDEMPIRTTLRDLAAGELVLEVLAERPDAAPRVGVLCPGSDYRMDGSDMPAFLLPPPAEASYSVPPELGAVRLLLRAGVDRSAFAQPVPSGARVGFTIDVDGARVFDGEVALEETLDWAGTEWLDVPGGGLELVGGSEVRLRTEVRGWPDAPALPAGFGGLRLVRETRVPRERSSPERPNVVFVVMDTLRADRLSAYGYERETSPHLARLASRGVRFEEAYSTASWTWPATASLLTGLLPD